MLIAFLLLLPLVTAHVRLLYPPARYPALDFIDNKRTHAPCGVPKPINGTRTWLHSGRELNVTWQQTLPHHGGYRLELLNDNEEVIAVLTPSETFVGEDNTLKSFDLINLPDNLECSDCTIRILRQAIEYGNNYIFYSCADVNIVNEIPDGDTCLGQGERVKSKCNCNNLFSGENCQIKDECLENADCGTYGQCVSFGAYAYPRTQCYCAKGYYGERCEHETKTFTNRAEFREDLYDTKEINQEGDRLYWRILEDEVEVVLKVRGHSWAAVGWKSQNSSCPSIMQYARKTYFEDSVEKIVEKSDENVSNVVPSEVIEIAENETMQQRKNEMHPTESNLEEKQVSCANNEEFKNCPEFTRQCEASCDWTRFPETIPNCPHSCGTPKCVCKEGFVRVSVDNDTCVPFNFCTDDAQMDCPVNSTWAKCGVACEPTCENMYDTSPCPATCDESACTCADNFVRHGDQCIFWGDCPNLEEHWATDAATEDLTVDERSSTVSQVTKATPTVEEETSPKTIEHLTCGINETINKCGRACEPDCVTVFVREHCELCTSPACTCLQGYARIDNRCIYWGDCPLEVSGLQTVSTVKSVVIVEKLSAQEIPTTTTTTPAHQTVPSTTPEVSAHVLAAKSVTHVNAIRRNPQPVLQPIKSESHETGVAGDVCYGDWRWPVGCRDCDYRISWNYLDDTDEIEFSVETRAPSNWWTGVGFSPTGTMVEADMIIVKSRNGILTLHDMYSTEYGIPREDSEQNVYTPTIVGTHVNGMLRAQFIRKRDTGDKKADHRFSDTNCYKFLFPVSGGRLDENGNILKHSTTPQVSERKICIKSCTSPQAVQPTSSCETEFRYPTGCEGAACDYVAKWEYSLARKDVRFEISSKELGRWTGIGFSRDGSMANSDIYTGWVYEGKAYVTDRFAYGRQLPAIDPADRQDIYEISGKAEDDVQTISFRRKVLPADTLTDFPLNKCYYFLFPIGGGRVLARKSPDFQNPKTPIGYHDLYQPRISRTKICICDQNGVSIASEDVPPAVRSRRQVQDPFELQTDPFVDLTSLELLTTPRATNLNQTEKQSTVSIQDVDQSHEESTVKFEVEIEPEPEPVPDSVAEPSPPVQEEQEHAMDCTDIVIGSVVNGVSRVRDYYTISRATPRLDSFYDGEDSLTSAAAYEDDDYTTIVFRKPLKSNDPADNSIKNEPMTVIWAKGTHASTYTPPVGPSVFKEGSASDKTFFQSDVLKYHGVNNRGVLTINFFDTKVKQKEEKPGSDCSGSYSYPSKCKTNDCSYDLTWLADGKKVSFILKAKMGTNRWTGIGFSSDGLMANSDAIIISVYDDSSVDISDQFAIGYGRPKIDADQGIFDTRVIYNDGILYANFSRNLVSDDSYDVSLDQCLYFLYVVNEGELEEGTKAIRRHPEPPKASRRRICLVSCSQTTNISFKKVVETEKVLQSAVLPEEGLVPPKATYEVKFRILNRIWDSALTDAKSKQFQTLADELTTAINKAISPVWPDMKVSNIVKFSEGSVLADVLLVSGSSDSPPANRVNILLEEKALRGPIEDFLIEPTTISTKKVEFESKVISENLRNWLIIGVGVFLFMIATFLICCLINRSRQKKTSQFAGYPAQYPNNGYGYNITMTGMNEKKGFDNAAYQTSHARQFSQATTASQNGKGSPNVSDDSPKGVGETTYQEWLNKVASKPASQQHEEVPMPSPSTRAPPSRQSFLGLPYGYTNDASGYCGMPGDYRMPPPGYYRPY